MYEKYKLTNKPKKMKEASHCLTNKEGKMRREAYLLIILISVSNMCRLFFYFLI